jgi:hypothetical protein
MASPSPKRQSSETNERANSRCPHCKSARIHRSHRRGSIDLILSRVGAELRRCHDCRRRYAFFGVFAMPLGVRDSRQDGLSTLLLFGVAFSVCLLVVWWMIRRLTIPAG